MPIDTMLMDATGHFFGGVGLAVADYMSSRALNPKSKRVEEKKECMESIELLLDAETNGDMPKDSKQYVLNIQNVRDYLVGSGMAKMELPWTERTSNFFRSLFVDEKINNLTWRQKLAVAVGAELIYDSLIGFRYYTDVLQESPIAALARNLYQIPVMFAGLVVGKGVTNVVDWFLTSSEERQMDKTIKQLLKETPILDVITNYTPSEQVQQELKGSGVKDKVYELTGAGKDYARKAAAAVGSVLNYRERRQQREAEEDAGRQARFNDLTKGR